jgi:hypothetical protein
MMINSSSQFRIRTLKDPDRSGKIIDAARSSQRSSDNGRRRDKIVGKSIVQITL